MNKKYNPEYYKYGGIQTIDFIEAKGLNFNLGNVVKYISRSGKKDTENIIDDLMKARWYLDHEINIQKQIQELEGSING